MMSFISVEVPGRKGPTTFSRDEHNRPDTTAESLAKLRPAFRKDGTITAGNAPGLNTAAAAMVVAEPGWAEANGLTPSARLVSCGIGAVLTTRLLHSMQRDGRKRGIVTLCIGGRQGIAQALETL